MAVWRLELDGKIYHLNLEKDVRITDLEQFEQWYGEDYGSALLFRRKAYNGHHGALRCVVWLARRAAGEKVPADARQMVLPPDFSPIEWMDQWRLADAEEAGTKAKADDAAPLEAEASTSLPAGTSGRSAGSKAST